MDFLMESVDRNNWCSHVLNVKVNRRVSKRWNTFVASKSQTRRWKVDSTPSCLSSPAPPYPPPPRPRSQPQFSLLVLLKTGSQAKLPASSVLYFLGRDCQILLSFLLIISCVCTRHDRTRVSAKILQRTANLPFKRKWHLLAIYKDKCSFIARDETFQRS